MARINIEECWWSDPRRTKLLLKIGFAADAAAVNMWRIAQEYWKGERNLIPLEIFNTIEFGNELIECGLAVVRDRSVYVRGSSQHLDWVREKRDQAREAGKRSAEVRRKKNGSAQPKGGKGSKKSEREPNENRTKGNGTEPSVSGSLSGSISVVAGNSTPPPNYARFAEQHDPVKQELCVRAEQVVQEVLGVKLSPGWRNLIPTMMRNVNWDPDEFVRVAARVNTSLEERTDSSLTYREVVLKREFGLIREASV